MDDSQRMMEQDFGPSGLMRNVIKDRWDRAKPNGGYRFNTVPQHSRRWGNATVGTEDGSHFALITIPAQVINFFDYKQGESLSDFVSAANYQADAVDTSLLKPGQLDADEEMVIESIEFHGALLKPKWTTMPYAMAAGDVVDDSYGTLVAVELGSGKALHDVLVDAFLSQARLYYQYQGGKAGQQYLGPGLLAAGGFPYAVGKNRPKFEIPEGLFWGSEQNPTQMGTAPESKLTIIAETKQSVKILGSFGATARVPTIIAFGITAVARGINFAPTGRTN